LKVPKEILLLIHDLDTLANKHGNKTDKVNTHFCKNR